MLYKFFITLFLACVLLIANANADCSSADVQKINDCYQTNVFKKFNIPANPQTFWIQIQNLAISSDGGAQKVCDAKKTLDDCLGAEIIQNCFDVKDFKKVLFVAGDDDGANKMVTNYLQLNYACGSNFDLAMSTGKCVIKNIKVMGACDGGNAGTCNGYTDYLNCGVKKVNDACGKASGCFVHKYLTLENCYYNRNCTFCSTFADKSNSNPVDGICSDDGNSGNKIFTSLNLIVICLFFSYAFLS